MGEQPPNRPGAYTAYIAVALGCAASSFFIAFVVIMRYDHLSDSGFWSLAALVASPALLGIGVSYSIASTSRPRGPYDLE